MIFSVDKMLEIRKVREKGQGQ